MRAAHRLRSESGYSLIELLISAAIMVVVTGAIFSLVNPSQGTAQAQPEVADLQQRMRIGSETLFKELVMTGAGTYQGSVTGSLVNFFAPILPRRVGRAFPNNTGATFEPFAITMMYIPNTYSQTTISSPMPNVSAELKVTDQTNCPQGQNLCGFQEGMSVIIFDTSGHFDVFEITEVQDAAAHLQHRGQDLSHPYNAGASVTQIISYSYYWCSPLPGSTPCPGDATASQLRRYNGAFEDIPVVDHVVGLQFTYFGDPNPPVQPRPPAGQANCLYDAAGNYVGPGALPPTDGSLAELPPAILRDGPMCGANLNEFDADLLRIRKVRVSLRVQAALDRLRGVGPLWRNPGTSAGGERLVPDYNVTFDVTPRNLNLAR
ncbi:MAG TPA: prepilin-type N-terminal cleavage/methylation domain-containing protein [Vicinamibacterales bacterium]|nr:prepilin-type N-terminal cleavage/methylation domain-containing protein [Vicinamibacterales bacterium]